MANRRAISSMSPVPSRLANAAWATRWPLVRSALLTHQAVYGASLVVVMDPRQGWRLRARFGVTGARVVVMGDLDPLPIRTRAIHDPWEAGDEVLESAYARVGRCARAMADALSEP